MSTATQSGRDATTGRFTRGNRYAEGSKIDRAELEELRSMIAEFKDLRSEWAELKSALEELQDQGNRQ